VTDVDQPAADRHNAPDGFAALKDQVSKRHHVLLDRNDPIAMLHTVNEMLVAETAAGLERAQNAVLTKFCHELEQSASTWKQEAKALGMRTLEAASRISAAQIAQATQELMTALALERERSRQAIKRAALCNAIVLFLAVVLLLLVTARLGALCSLR
jgi:hypothetical protein